MNLVVLKSSYSNVGQIQKDLYAPLRTKRTHVWKVREQKMDVTKNERIWIGNSRQSREMNSWAENKENTSGSCVVVGKAEEYLTKKKKKKVYRYSRILST